VPFEVVDIPRFKSARLVWTLEAGGAASAEIDIRPDDPGPVWTPPHRLLVTGPKDWGGEVSNFHRSGSPTEGMSFTATAVGHALRLDKRIVRHVYEVNDTADVHVRALLSELQQNQYNGDMGFQFGNAVGTFASRLKAYCFGLNAGDAIRELAAQGRGFDWEIDAQGYLNMWGPSRGTDTGLTLDPEACHDIEIEFDSSEMVTTVTAFGDNSDPYGPKHTLVRNLTADNFGRRETVINTDIITLDEKNPNWLQDLEDAGRGVLKEYGGAQITMKTTWLSNNAPWNLGAVWLADSANVLLADYFGGTRKMRCTDVTVTLDPMPPRSGGAAPIYFVEMGWDALINDADMLDGDPDGGDG
jgi:hypothetical protein